MQQNDAFDRFRNYLNTARGDFHLLERSVPLEKQVEYFKFSSRLRKSPAQLKDEDFERFLSELNDPGFPQKEKQKILSTLAVSKQAKAYGILKRYASEADADLSDWAHMALTESRITLEFEFSGEKQIFISTGLGGKGKRMRLFVLLTAVSNAPFLDYQRRIIQQESIYFLSAAGCRIERLTVKEAHAEIVLLLPIHTDIRRVLTELILECNLYGNFLSQNLTVTNVKELDESEIAQILKSRNDLPF